MPHRRALTAPCGLDCFNCPIYVDNITDALADRIHAYTGVARGQIPCRGCRLQDGRHFSLPASGCATLNCVKAKGVEFCCDCAEFPCARLAPIADQAAAYPHNLKLYNLCRIRKIGIERWIAEEAGEIRRRYFSNKFFVGRGQGD